MSKRKHPSSRRTPQTPNEQDDAFVAGAIDFSQWARTHQQTLTFIGIVLVLLLAGGVYYVRFQRSLTIQAVNRLEIIHETIAFSAFEDAKTQLSTFLDQFGRTDQAREAVILLGRLHLEGGMPRWRSTYWSAPTSDCAIPSGSKLTLSWRAPT